MDSPVSIANIITILVGDHVVSLGFIYLLVRLLTGGKPILERRRGTDSNHHEERES